MDSNKLILEPVNKALVNPKVSVISIEGVFLNKSAGLMTRLDSNGVVGVVLS